MNARATLLVLVTTFGLGACRLAPPTPDYNQPLPEGADALIPVPAEERPSFAHQWAVREEVMVALERSIDWTQGNYSKQFFPIAGITHERALASLTRFREILMEAQSDVEFELALAREFTVFKSAGWNGKGGGVLFTGYCTPILDGRRVADSEYRYPLYRTPSDLVKGEAGAILGQQTTEGLRPYPTREAIEASALLEGQGLELAWLRDPIDAYIAHVNGSAFIDVGEADLFRVGYSAKNGRPYTSLGRKLVEGGELEADEVSLASIRRWARDHPQRIHDYLNHNESYVFFTEIEGNPRGSLNVEVESGRSLATDKRLFPRGALVYVEATLGDPGGGERNYDRFMFDQDTGGAIRTAGRADLYVGIGPEAEGLAGTTRSEGQLYYLFLTE